MSIFVTSPSLPLNLLYTNMIKSESLVEIKVNGIAALQQNYFFSIVKATIFDMKKMMISKFEEEKQKVIEKTKKVTIIVRSTICDGAGVIANRSAR